MLDELGRSFRPEFLNRIDDIIVFNKLSREHLGKIVDLRLADVERLLADKKIVMEVSERAKELLLSDGYDEQFGARPLKRSIQRLIQDPLALKLLDGTFGEGDTVIVDRDGNKMGFEKRAVAEAEVEVEVVPA